MSEQHVDPRRRRFLTTLATGVGLVGTGFAVTPFIESMLPSARAEAAGAPVEVDLGKVRPGQMIRVAWHSKPIFIVHRTPKMLASLAHDHKLLRDPDSKQPQQPKYCQNQGRSIKPEYLVMIGICTHLGCVPNPRFTPGAASHIQANWPGGFLCPCHGSKYDLAGRVFLGVPAPLNMVIPPYSYLSDTRIIIGVGEKGQKGVA
ncbi:MAG: ubiquinol-cytochrome c reductase iron-sulfur subunit [Acidiferrobacteraceae bacterium]